MDAPSVRKPRRPRPLLTPREQEVAVLIADGLTNSQIAAELVISERTVDTHAEHIRAKLDVRSRAEIAGWVARRMPLTPDPLSRAWERGSGVRGGLRSEDRYLTSAIHPMCGPDASRTVWSVGGAIN